MLNGQVEARRLQQEQEEGEDRAMDLAMLARRGSLDPEIAQALANAAAAERRVPRRSPHRSRPCAPPERRCQLWQSCAIRIGRECRIVAKSSTRDRQS